MFKGPGRRPSGVQKHPWHRSKSPNPPQSKQSIEAVVVETIPRGHSALEEAKRALASAAALVTMRTINDRTVITNNGGGTLLEEIGELRAEIKESKAQIQELSDQVKHCQKLATSYEDVRERCFLTYLRDHVRGKREKYQKHIKLLNQGPVHGGNCVADSEVIKKHEPDGPYYFQKIYGVAPEVVTELNPDKHDCVIRVLNLVGGLRLNTLMMQHKESAWASYKTTEREMQSDGKFSVLGDATALGHPLGATGGYQSGPLLAEL
ncbi:hypothetical protein PVAR5_8680 [Paecilomyces variotii No. 5]|uniref:Uncharacterized protein n=1 Tax=Byssochlamys spectabilis (strain No. 5 / NBRC 109023) TaxID=1356009 RepID=V5FPI9_BYSSN|nr:hypothetical protein PVAR5_8680 [Paecilomyces variotii No. 5]